MYSDCRAATETQRARGIHSFLKKIIVPLGSSVRTPGWAPEAVGPPHILFYQLKFQVYWYCEKVEATSPIMKRSETTYSYNVKPILNLQPSGLRCTEVRRKRMELKIGGLARMFQQEFMSCKI